MCLTPLSTIFQLYRGCRFYWWRKPEYPEKITDLSRHWQTLSHNVVSSTPSLNDIRSDNVELYCSFPVVKYPNYFYLLITLDFFFFKNKQFLIFTDRTWLWTYLLQYQLCHRKCDICHIILHYRWCSEASIWQCIGYVQQSGSRNWNGEGIFPDTLGSEKCMILSKIK